MNNLKLASVLALGAFFPIAAFASPVCPTFSGDPINAGNSNGTDCNVLITIGSTGTVTITPEATGHPYDGNEDQLIGVVDNYTAGPISALTLNGGSNDIFGFDGDGIDTFLSHVSDPSDNSGYGGPDSYFTGINGGKTTGTVDFSTALTHGTTTYFSLEGDPASGTFTAVVGSPTPEPSSLILLGTGALGIAGSLRRRFTNMNS
jgi:hypothetical protein